MWEWEVGVGSWELLGEWEETFPTPTLMVKVGVEQWARGPTVEECEV